MDYKGFEKEKHFDGFSFYCGDCMDLLKQTPDKYYDLCIVDPPYGIDINKMNMGGRNTVKPSSKTWDNHIPDTLYFEELFRVSKNQIIWGGNYFPLPPSQYFAIWDKGETMYGRDFAEMEYAWVSSGGTRIFKKSPNQLDRIHPTQKPVQLYKWLLQKYAKEGDKILDTHLGSASIALAIDKSNKADGMELDFVGIELDKDYFDSAMKRFSEGRQQMFLNLNVE